MNIECRRNEFYLFYKKIERSLRLVEAAAPTPRRANPSFVILRFDIRYSAVRCLIQAVDAGILIIEKPCYFGVVSYKRRLWPRASAVRC
jgi:hypothetical protein